MHATLAGVILGLLTPSIPLFPVERYAAESEKAGPMMRAALEKGDTEVVEGLLGRLGVLNRESEAPLDRMERIFHPWSSFFVLPVFALANAGVEISAQTAENALSSPIAWGIVLGLVGGKIVGIVGLSWVAVRTGLAQLPPFMNWTHAAGVAATAGIGFTVSLFISDMAFADLGLRNEAKMAVLAGSALAALAGWSILRFTAPPTAPGGDAEPMLEK